MATMVIISPLVPRDYRPAERVCAHCYLAVVNSRLLLAYGNQPLELGIRAGVNSTYEVLTTMSSKLASPSATNNPRSPVCRSYIRTLMAT